MWRIKMWRDVKWFIENCIKFRKFLWDDRWFDHHYFFTMIRHKLKNDLCSYKEYAISIESENIIKQIERCIALLNRIISDDYELYNMDAFKKAHINRQNDINNLFDYMKIHITEWWD